MAVEYSWYNATAYYMLSIYDPFAELTELEIPDYHNGLPVRFVRYESCASSGLPSNYVESNLETIKIPHTCREFYAMYLKKQGIKIYYDSLGTFLSMSDFSLSWYGGEEPRGTYRVYFNYYESEDTVHNIIIPNEYTDIRLFMFMDIENIISVKGDGITHIDQGVFLHCTSLSRVELPNLHGFEGNGGEFVGCPYLSYIALCDTENVIADGNRLYTIQYNSFSGDVDYGDRLYADDPATYHTDLVVVVPKSTRIIWQSGSAEHPDMESVERLIFYTGNQDPLLLELREIEGTSAMPKPSVGYGINKTLANYGEWYFLEGYGAVIKGQEPSLEAQVFFTLPIKDFTQAGLGKKFPSIGKYQTNKYYLAGSFDYMIRGSIGSSDTQPLKGNIMHLRSFEIKYFDDSINIDHDDLVVIDGRLYGVEELAYDIKRSPKPYTVYFATLNNIK